MRKKRFTGAAVAVLAVATTMFTGGTTAHASASCYGSSCNGLDPVVMGCLPGAYVVSDAGAAVGNRSFTAGYVENWFSPACGANWARVATVGGDADVLFVAACRSDHLDDDAYCAKFNLTSRGSVAYGNMWDGTAGNGDNGCVTVEASIIFTFGDDPFWGRGTPAC